MDSTTNELPKTGVSKNNGDDPAEAPSNPAPVAQEVAHDVEWIPIAQAARLLGVDRRTVNRWIRFNCSCCQDRLVYVDPVGWIHPDGNAARFRTMTAEEAGAFEKTHGRPASEQERLVKDHDAEPVPTGGVVAKRTKDGWIVRADSLPEYPRLRRPHAGVRLEVTPEMEDLRNKINDLSCQLGYWRGQADSYQKLLPESQAAIEKRQRELEESKQKLTVAETLKTEIESRWRESERGKEEAIKKAAEAEAQKKVIESQIAGVTGQLVSTRSKLRWISIAAASIVLILACILALNVKGVSSKASATPADPAYSKEAGMSPQANIESPALPQSMNPPEAVPNTQPEVLSEAQK